ncbi:hypothetical protein TNCV_4054371 [Trichonephila clavipes]|nr:hypothetical protein TNCV_4054371 [Trichonephila clavipes]
MVPNVVGYITLFARLKSAFEFDTLVLHHTNIRTEPRQINRSLSFQNGGSSAFSIQNGGSTALGFETASRQRRPQARELNY